MIEWDGDIEYDKAVEQERLCSTCGWPFAAADPNCGHEGGDDDG